jgi:prepilin signal peptidase PulO-like enzyme (type II secretory pathway)
MPAELAGEGDAASGLPWISTWVVVVSLSALVASLLVMGVHGKQGYFAGVLATTVCLLAALFDAFTARIPNQVTYPAAAAGVIINLAATIYTWLHFEKTVTWLAAPGIEQSLWALAVCVPLALVGMWFRVGGGDLKLLVALGAILGLLELGSVLIIALTVAMVYAILNLLAMGRLNNAMKMLAMQGLELVFLRKFPRDESHALGGRHVPMAVPVAIGLVVAQIVNVQAVLGVGK